MTHIPPIIHNRARNQTGHLLMLSVFSVGTALAQDDITCPHLSPPFGLA